MSILFTQGVLQETASNSFRRDPLTRSSRPALREDGTTLSPKGERVINSNAELGITAPS